MNTSRSLPPEPPARGSFPLDHGGLCKAFMRTYLTCARVHAQAHHLCRDESKAYLQCRMDKCVGGCDRRGLLPGPAFGVAAPPVGIMPTQTPPPRNSAPRPHTLPPDLPACPPARASRNLMAQEDLNSLGFDPAISVIPGSEQAEAGGEVIAGLAAAKRRKVGVLFGIGSDAKRGGGH